MDLQDLRFARSRLVEDVDGYEIRVELLSDDGHIVHSMQEPASTMQMVLWLEEALDENC